MRDLHDFNVTALEINASERYIVLHASRMDPSNDRVQAIFEGVVGHHFEHILEGNIINQIENVIELEKFYEANEKELTRYGDFGLTLDLESGLKFKEDLHRRGLQLYEIFSSYGLSGWVCCRMFNVIADPQGRA